MSSGAEDDDLDDILDSALEEFDVGPVSGVEAPTPESTDNSEPSPAHSADLREDEAIRAFEEALKTISELDAEKGGGAPGGPGDEADLKLVEDFMKSLGSQFGGMGLGGLGAGAGGGAAERERDSASGGAGGSAGVASGGGGVANGADAMESPDVEKLVESIVGELLSEDVLKGPMVQMRESFARWLPANEATLSKEDLARFTKQRELVVQICEAYEEGSDSSRVMELLTKMQECGAPPPAVMSELSGDDADGVRPGLPGVPPDVDKLTERCMMQ